MSDKIEISPYDDEWPEHFKSEAQYLMSTLPQDILLEFHHIGSTAIPEMPAKPIIDIGVMITDYDDATQKLIPELKKSGYEHLAEASENENRILFVKRDENKNRTHHIHFCEEEEPFWDCLYFREYLKKHEHEARNYFELKMALAKQFPDDREAYTNGKSEYIKRITEIAKKELDEFI